MSGQPVDLAPAQAAEETASAAAGAPAAVVETGPGARPPGDGWLWQRTVDGSRADLFVSWALFALPFALLWLTERAVGYPRDEGTYFAAAQLHAGWFDLLFTRPAEALKDAAIVRAFERPIGYGMVEHPAVMKNLFGLSYWLFHQKLGLLEPATALRLPAFAVAALVGPLSYRLGAGVFCRGAGLFAAVAFFLVPRQVFNSYLAAFDVPVAALWLFTVYAFWRAMLRPRWWLIAGAAFGVALCTKHNSFFLPLLAVPFAVGLFWVRTKDAREARRTGLAFLGIWAGAAALYGLLALLLREKFLERFTLLSPHTFLFLAAALSSAVLLWPLRARAHDAFRPLATLWAMAVLGPALLYALWPYLWHDPVPRVAHWLGFHARHNHYAWFYLGVLQREPPFPWAYVLVKTALTVPLSLFVPMVLGFGSVALRLLARPVSALRAYVAAADWQEALIFANAVLSIAVISHPDVPIFGGVKHWFPSMPFLGLLAGATVAASARALFAFLCTRTATARVPSWAVAAAFAALLFAPAVWATVRVLPWGTSYYSELGGGLPGAASLGMQRQFWSQNVTGVLPWINEHAPPNARVWLHEVTGQSFHQYQRDGQLRRDLRMAHGAAGADIAAYQYHQEFREQEFGIWEAFGTTRPSFGLYLDETPQVMVYRRHQP